VRLVGYLIQICHDSRPHKCKVQQTLICRVHFTALSVTEVGATSAERYSDMGSEQCDSGVPKATSQICLSGLRETLTKSEYANLSLPSRWGHDTSATKYFLPTCLMNCLFVGSSNCRLQTSTRSLNKRFSFDDPIYPHFIRVIYFSFTSRRIYCLDESFASFNPRKR
jgi:hypothetical protein